MICDNCGVEFNPVASRWLCPNCHWKSNCCDGAPAGRLPEAGRPEADIPVSKTPGGRPRRSPG